VIAVSQPGIMLVESEILIRQPLAEYLRECGYRVFEAATTAEAARLLTEGEAPIEVVLADIGDVMADSGVGFASWMRSNFPEVDVVLAGSVPQAARKAGELCEEGPDISKPYDHQLVLERIKRLLAARQRSG
jgi:DNA-binding response OmpR family regulator